ncbi:MAG: hypothetical protein HY902_12520, partial [Deltaproteobacteria bacterium]|nr:hypothetical protein [Deltaproteobacteria bacterium]
MAQRRLQLADEKGQVPPSGLVQARQHVEQMRAAKTAAGPSPKAGIASGSWKWLGPGNIGGRIRSLVVHPTQPAKLWVGSVSGGIWHSANSGASWAPVDDFMASLAVTTLAIDPTNPDIMYAGTGEGFYNLHAIHGGGVFRSTDGGKSWSHLPATSGATFKYVQRLALVPGQPQTLLVASSSGILRSVDSGQNWKWVAGVSAGGGQYVTATDVVASADGKHALAGMFWALVLHSADGGATWKYSAGIPSSGSGSGRAEVAFAPSQPQTAYAVVDLDGGSLFRSDDSGSQWSLVSKPAHLAAQGWFDNSLWIDPTNANTLVIGGVDLWRSTDGGVQFAKISDWRYSPYSAHADHHIMVADPGYNGTTNRAVWFGNDGGVFRAADVLNVAPLDGWQSHNHNLGITQFYGAAAMGSSGRLIAGSQDNGTLRFLGDPEDWATVMSGDGGFCAADASDAKLAYGEYVNLDVFRTQDGAWTAEYISGKHYNAETSQWEWKSQPYVLGDAKTQSALFIAPLVADPKETQRLYGGGVSLWRTTDAKAPLTTTSGPAWAAIKPPTTDKSPISAVAVSPVDNQVGWVGHVSGALFVTGDLQSPQPTWTAINTTAAGLPARYVTSILADAKDPAAVWVTYGGFSADNLWRTSNGGQTWQVLTGQGSTALPKVPLRSVAVAPQNSAWLYVGTEVGIFTSEDGGQSWTVPTDGPSNVAVDQLLWMKQSLVAVTHGRGIFRHSVCDPGKACDDFDACTSGDTCTDQKQCQGDVVSCDDGNPCTLDLCVAVLGCKHHTMAACEAVVPPYDQPFNCSDAMNKAWTLPFAPIGPTWHIDGTPSDPGAASPACSLNLNNGTNFECASGQKSLDRWAASPWIDARGIAKGAPLVLQFNLAGVWENSVYDSLDIEFTRFGFEEAAEARYHVPPPTKAWLPIQLNLGSYGGQYFQFRFRFTTQDCFGNDGSGPFIDDVQLYLWCASDAACDDGNGCTTDVCTANACFHPANTDACQDGSVCSVQDKCKDGKCAAGAPLSCDDGNPCTTDSCDSKQGCASKPNSESCDDGDACTTKDACSGGKCAGGPAPVCDDGNPCTTDSCDSKQGCVVKPNSESCDDGDACTTKDTCSDGKCAGGPAPVCDDGNPCTLHMSVAVLGCKHHTIAACEAEEPPYDHPFTTSDAINPPSTLPVAA